MDEDIRKELRDHAWSYFVLHAEQRLKTFHFYLIVATLIGGGVLALAKGGSASAGASPMAFLLPFLSFVFWKLDERNKQLIKHGEEALKLIENDSGLHDSGEEPHRLKLFLHEEYATAKRPRLPHWPPWRAHFSYSTCFRGVFIAFGLSGLVAGVILLLTRGT